MKLTFIAALVLAASTGGCVAPRHPAAPTSDGVMNALEWSLGAPSRVLNPPSADAYLLLLPKGKPLEQGMRQTSECNKTTSFLPGPFGDPRIFLSVEGRLYVRRAPGQASTPLESADPALKVRRLLAFVAAESPLALLVEAQPAGASSVQIWLFTVSEREIRSQERFDNDPSLQSEAAFFEKFRVPRCLEGPRDCLALSSDDHHYYLDVQPRRGQRPTLLQDLGVVDVRDAAWASADGQSVYLLVSCPPSRR
jgi:hypothetical protein